MLRSSDFLQSESNQVLEAILELAVSCILSLGTDIQKYKIDVFKILL